MCVCVAEQRIRKNGETKLLAVVGLKILCRKAQKREKKIVENYITNTTGSLHKCLVSFVRKLGSQPAQATPPPPSYQHHQRCSCRRYRRLCCCYGYCLHRHLSCRHRVTLLCYLPPTKTATHLPHCNIHAHIKTVLPH